MATAGSAAFISIVGDTAGVDTAIKHLQGKLDNSGMVKFLGGIIYPFLRSRVTERFSSEGDDASGPWAPLQEATNNWRELGGFPRGHPINYRTGEMYRFITSAGATVVPSGAGTVMKYPGQDPPGPIAKKIRTAQRGRTAPRATVPRPVLSIGLTDVNFTLGSLALYIQNQGTP